MLSPSLSLSPFFLSLLLPSFCLSRSPLGLFRTLERLSSESHSARPGQKYCFIRKRSDAKRRSKLWLLGIINKLECFALCGREYCFCSKSLESSKVRSVRCPWRDARSRSAFVSRWFIGLTVTVTLSPAPRYSTARPQRELDQYSFRFDQ